MFIGGDIFFIECSFSKGKGKLIFMGNLGDVMKEFVIIVFSYLKVQSEIFGIFLEDFEKYDIYLYVL